MSASKKIVSGVFWTTLNSVIGALYSFVSVPILLVHFGKNEYGLIGIAMSINVYLRIMDLGFASGNVKFFAQNLALKNFEMVNKLFQSSLVLYLSIALVNALLLLIMTFFAKDLFNLTVEQSLIVKNLFYILMISSVLGWLSSLMDQFLKANEIIGWEQRLIILTKLLQAIVLLLTVKYNYSIVLFFALTTFSSILILPVSIWRIKKLNYSISMVPKYYHKIFKDVLGYSLHIFSFGIFQFSAVYLRPLILGIRTNLSTVADYRVLEGIANMVMLLGTSFVGVILPIAAKAAALKEKEKENQIAYDGTKYITIFLCLIVFAFLLISKDLLYVYVGEQYVDKATWLNIWILTLLTTHNSAVSSLVLSGNNLRPIVYISMFSSLTSLVLAWFLSPIFQVGAVVLCYLFYCTSQLSFYYLYYYKKIMNIDSKQLFINSFLIPTSYFIIIFFIIKVLFTYIHINNIYLRIIITLILFSTCSLCCVYFKILNKSDKSFIENLISKKYK